MRKGKMIAQGAHASMSAVLINNGTAILATEAAVEWFANSYTKVGVSVNSEEELLAIHAKAKAANLPCSLILDKGKTIRRSSHLHRSGSRPHLF